MPPALHSAIPFRLIGSPGQRHDIALAHALVANAAIADKGYDADHLCDRLDHRTLAR
jgi:putative transposase